MADQDDPADAPADRDRAALTICSRVAICLKSVSGTGIAQDEGDEMSLPPSEIAGLFLKYTYPEWKGMAVQFLTLASATLVLSVTFSEKVIGFQSASIAAKRAMFSCWTALILAIILAGISICFLLWAVNIASYQSVEKVQIIRAYGYSWADFWNLATILLVAAGFIYTSALVCLVVAARWATKAG
jgi:hypothetical protein